MNDVVILTPDEVEANKQKIIALFRKNVKGRVADVSQANSGHDGRHGHWLEQAMGVQRNNSNTPDLLGFEMKNATQSRTTFGDWSADYRLFSKRSGGTLTQDEFLRYFGQPNPEHDGRFAWSGRICPQKVGEVNIYGQQLIVDEQNNIRALYYFSKDQRPNKASIIPVEYQKEGLVLAKWSHTLMRKRVESKFNQNGWFKCLKDRSTGVYTRIVFGDPITFENWIDFVKSGDIIFDSGLHQGNARPYANWRSNNSFWNKLITTQYS